MAQALIGPNWVDETQETPIMWTNRFSFRRSHTARRKPIPPTLEALEGRWVPTTVTNLNDAGPGSLRQAIANTRPAETVDFEKGLCGTIRLTSATLTINKLLTIAGPGADCITVSGNHALQVFNIPAPWTVTISGLTIANGYTDYGGGGISNAGALTINGCTLSDNSASSFFSGNGGGGILNSGSLTVASSTLSGNISNFDGGGGIKNDNGGTAILTSSTLIGNISYGRIGGGGGGIINRGTLSVTSSTFSGNSADYYGGGIYNTGGALSVTSSTFNLNAASNGGGIDNDRGNSNVTIANSTFNLNAAVNGGGIADQSFGMTTLTSSTLNDNRASNQGGGIFHESNPGSRMIIRDTIVAGNRAFMPSADVSGNVVSQCYNLIGNGTDSSGFNLCDLVGTADMPIDPLLVPLDNYGGPTKTMALSCGSPALNAGDPAELGSPDQRGVVRTGGVNVGSYQASATAFGVTAPDAAQAGMPFDVTLRAEDPFEQTAVGYTGTVTFSSADPYGATLPAAYTFAAGDCGEVTFAAETALYTAGTWDVTATDPDNGITGNAMVAVTPAPAVGFVLTAPGSVLARTPFAVTVTAVDPYGNTDSNYQGTVTWTTTDLDPGVVLPADYAFQASDQGVHTFGVTLITVGDQIITATDTSSGITGSAPVTVSSTGPGASPRPGRRPESPDPMALDRLFDSRARERWEARGWAALVGSPARAHRGTAADMADAALEVDLSGA